MTTVPYLLYMPTRLYLNTTYTVSSTKNGLKNNLSLSTIVLNSRDWSEIVWLPKILHLKINLAIGFIRRKPAGMHWLGYNNAVSWLNKAKTRIFQPTANFEIFEIYLYFVCLPACQPACLPCTSLHRELRDYSLGQIAFAIFQALFAITQLLFQVNALLTSACKQA